MGTFRRMSRFCSNSQRLFPRVSGSQAFSCSIGEFIKETLSFHQFLIFADFDDPSGFHNRNEIEITNHLQAMNHGDQGLLPLEFDIEQLLYPGLGSIVKARRRLIQNENVRVLEQRASDPDLLLLTAGEAISFAAHLKFQPHFPHIV